MDQAAPRPTSLSRGQKRRISEVFSECDEGHKGYLSSRDLKVASVALLGYKPSKYEQQKVLGLCKDVIGQDGQQIKGLCFEHFEEAMAERLCHCDAAEEIRQIFLAFDRKCQGFLTLADLEAAVSSISPHLSSSTISSIFREIDRDGDGRVSFKDFDIMMRYESYP